MGIIGGDRICYGGPLQDLVGITLLVVCVGVLGGCKVISKKQTPEWTTEPSTLASPGRGEVMGQQVERLVYYVLMHGLKMDLSDDEIRQILEVIGPDFARYVEMRHCYVVATDHFSNPVLSRKKVADALGFSSGQLQALLNTSDVQELIEVQPAVQSEDVQVSQDYDVYRIQELKYFSCRFYVLLARYRKALQERELLRVFQTFHPDTVISP